MDIALRLITFGLAAVLGILSGDAALAAKPTFHVEKEIVGGVVDNLGAAANFLPLPVDGKADYPVLLDGRKFGELGDGVIETLRSAFATGTPLLILGPTAETRNFLDDLTGGEVRLSSESWASPQVTGEPILEAIGVHRSGGSVNTAEFWRTFDANIGSEEEEEAEDEVLAASILQWSAVARDDSAGQGAEAGNPRAAGPPTSALAIGGGAARPAMAKASPGHPSIDDVTSSVVKRVNFQFDQGSMGTVIKSWAAFSPDRQEDWYIFEFTTISNPLNFATRSAPFVLDPLQNNDKYCRGIIKTRCLRDRFATEVEIKVRAKTDNLELVYYGPDSDRSQDEYTYSSSFSLGGKVTAGYEQKSGPKAGVELSAGATFSRSTTVTIRDATLVGISNPALELAGWRFEMPKLRAVQDLTEFGGPKMDCANLLQMPYPIQRGSMESRQYAIFRLPAAKRKGLKTIDLTVDLRVVEGTADLQNWTSGSCNLFNCNCTPRNWEYATQELKGRVVSFPLASHQAG